MFGSSVLFNPINLCCTLDFMHVFVCMLCAVVFSWPRTWGMLALMRSWKRVWQQKMWSNQIQPVTCKPEFFFGNLSCVTRAVTFVLYYIKNVHSFLLSNGTGWRGKTSSWPNTQRNASLGRSVLMIFPNCTRCVMPWRPEIFSLLFRFSLRGWN